MTTGAPPGKRWGYAGSPIIHDGQVMVQCDANKVSYWAAFDGRTEGDVFVIEAADTFKPSAVNDMGELCMATPATRDGKLFIRTVRLLYCIGM